MQITVNLLASLRKLAGDRAITLSLDSGATVADLLRAISDEYPALGARIIDGDGQLTGAVQIIINGRNVIWTDGLATILEPEHNITLIPPVAGG